MYAVEKLYTGFMKGRTMYVIPTPWRVGSPFKFWHY